MPQVTLWVRKQVWGGQGDSRVVGVPEFYLWFSCCAADFPQSTQLSLFFLCFGVLPWSVSDAVLTRLLFPLMNFYLLKWSYPRAKLLFRSDNRRPGVETLSRVLIVDDVCQIFLLAERAHLWQFVTLHGDCPALGQMKQEPRVINLSGARVWLLVGHG